MPTRCNVFVFGTLKQGFPLHEQGLSSAEYIGTYKTHQRYPMLIAGSRFSPMMFNEPGVGLQARGELYTVDGPTLAKLDIIESVGTPGNLRVPIGIERVEDGLCVWAHVYMKSRQLADPVHSAYLDFYDDRRFIPP